MPNTDLASCQLNKWKEKNKQNQCCITTSQGIAIPYLDSSITVGDHGPIVLSDFNLIEQLTHFGRERIPERVVHAKGAAAFGYFEVTKDITQYTVAKIFEKVGKKTPMGARFSQVIGNLGSADTVRDPRGFALKFYTEDGTWDLVGNNTPIFFIRDPALFPSLIHSQKFNPVTNLRDWNMFWDFLSLRPESVHQTMFVFSDRGIPDGHRHMDGFGLNTYSLINKDQNLTYVKFHFKTNQGIKNLKPSVATRIAGQDPDYAVRDLYNSIAGRKFPSWTLFVQLMTPEQAQNSPFDPFDDTKIWPHTDYPLHEVGKMVLNRNPTNFFAEVEQLAFSPHNLIPGIWFSPDRILQGRLFAYSDTQNHRLGVNHSQLPVNCPFMVRNFQRDGFATINNQGGAPNYHPNSFGGPEVNPNALTRIPRPPEISGLQGYHDLGKQDNYSQANKFYNKVLNGAERGRLIDNLADSIRSANKEIQNNCIKMFSSVDSSLGARLQERLRQIQNAKYVE